MPRHFLAFVVCYFHSVCFSVLSFVACGNGGKLRRKKAAGDMVDLFLVCLPFYSCVPLILIWFGATGRRPTGDIVGRLDMPSRLKDRLLNRTSQDPQLIPNGSIWQTLRKLHARMKQHKLPTSLISHYCGRGPKWTKIMKTQTHFSMLQTNSERRKRG